ncbi:MAG TPA: 1-aminocyclopropane-1-carboxylate deaminase [Microscillaceae bacterium]|nr:1-aminocyclopropane-1-carboxylate deaminase [Microscillaceae bacterium]
MRNPFHIPYQLLYHPWFADAQVQLGVLRLDQMEGIVRGNKWFKLLHVFEDVQKNEKRGIITYGGAYSNHIYATAMACNHLGLKSVGIIRGEETLPLNPVLAAAKAQGMYLHYINRATYRQKHVSEIKEQWLALYPDFYEIPEGGANHQAVTGCSLIPTYVPVPFDYIVCACGTGSTLAGLITGIAPAQTAIGISVLKGGDFLREAVRQFVLPIRQENLPVWEIQTSYHFGGYAKQSSELSAFVQFCKTTWNLPVEPVYTAKMFFGLCDLIRKGYFPKGSHIAAVHTGGLVPLYD